MNREWEELQEILQKASMYRAALSLMSWDSDTIAPPKAAEWTARFVGTISQEYFTMMTSPRVRDLAAAIDPETLDHDGKALLRHVRRTVENLTSIPAEEYRAYQELLVRSRATWKHAKDTNDFASFAPVLQQVIDTRRRFAALRVKDGETPYNVLLNDYEEGFPAAVLDPFFEKLKACVVPLLQRRTEALHERIVTRTSPLEKQKAFCAWLAAYAGFDPERGALGETEHPFNCTMHNHDSRLALHYYEHDANSAISSTMHESGHAIYEQQVDDRYTLTFLGGGASTAMHESQSRFFENHVGRSRAFWEPIYPTLQRMQPEAYGGVPFDEYMRELNVAVPNLVRIEADELTYSLHIIVRYELEKAFIDGGMKAEELPAAWNRKYQEYLGITPPTDTAGVLQDSHWGGGLIGYFPSYSIGSAIAAQVEAQLRRMMDFDAVLRAGELHKICGALREGIHRFGASKTADELLRDFTGKPFEPDDYLAYLERKFRV